MISGKIIITDPTFQSILGDDLPILREKSQDEQKESATDCKIFPLTWKWSFENPTWPAMRVIKTAVFYNRKGAIYIGHWASAIPVAGDHALRV
jgi:hypothetical protein